MHSKLLSSRKIALQSQQASVEPIEEMLLSMQRCGNLHMVSPSSCETSSLAAGDTLTASMQQNYSTTSRNLKPSIIDSEVARQRRRESLAKVRDRRNSLSCKNKTGLQYTKRQSQIYCKANYIKKNAILPSSFNEDEDNDTNEDDLISLAVAAFGGDHIENPQKLPVTNLKNSNFISSSVNVSQNIHHNKGSALKRESALKRRESIKELRKSLRRRVDTGQRLSSYSCDIFSNFKPKIDLKTPNELSQKNAELNVVIDSDEKSVDSLAPERSLDLHMSLTKSSSIRSSCPSVNTSKSNNSGRTTATTESAALISLRESIARGRRERQTRMMELQLNSAALLGSEQKEPNPSTDEATNKKNGTKSMQPMPHIALTTKMKELDRQVEIGRLRRRESLKQIRIKRHQKIQPNIAFSISNDGCVSTLANYTTTTTTAGEISKDKQLRRCSTKETLLSSLQDLQKELEGISID
mmetsp:Transcript_43592/g.52271  ORF Transcript_43592/g.52271 Transcript_43592/m.52271 type:complete len:468 (+) Transcript_43592:43-1446(+)